MLPPRRPREDFGLYRRLPARRWPDLRVYWVGAGVDEGIGVMGLLNDALGTRQELIASFVRG